MVANVKPAPLASTTVTWGTLGPLLRRMLPAVCKDLTRFHLSGLHFCADGLVATDGHRLHIHSEWGLASAVEPFTVPRAMLDAFMTLAKSPHLCLFPGHEVTISCELGRIAIAIPNLGVRIEAPAIDATYPNYRAVTPKNHPYSFEVPTSDLAKLARKAIKERYPDSDTVLTLGRTGTLVLTDTSPDAKSEDGTYPAIELATGTASIGDKTHQRIGINPKYLRDAMALMTAATTRIEFDGSLDAIKLTSGAATAVVMPARI